MVRPRKTVERLKKYRPPLEGRGGKMRLDFNENTVGCAPSIVRALRRALSAEWLSRYPEYEAGRQTLARYFGVSPEKMLLTNGTDDAIKMICDTFVDPGDVLVVLAPTFPVYQFFHEVAGGRVVPLPLRRGLPHAGRKASRSSQRADSLAGSFESQQPDRDNRFEGRLAGHLAVSPGHAGPCGRSLLRFFG